MTERDHDLDEGYVYLRTEDDHVEEQIGITETFLLEDNSPEVSRSLPYLLILTCGGAG